MIALESLDFMSFVHLHFLEFLLDVLKMLSGTWRSSLVVKVLVLLRRDPIWAEVLILAALSAPMWET